MRTDYAMSRIYGMAFVEESQSEASQRVIENNRMDFMKWLDKRDLQKEAEVLKKLIKRVQTMRDDHEEEISKAQYGRMTYFIGYLEGSLISVQESIEKGETDLP